MRHTAVRSLPVEPFNSFPPLADFYVRIVLKYLLNEVPAEPLHRGPGKDAYHVVYGTPSQCHDTENADAPSQRGAYHRTAAAGVPGGGAPRRQCGGRGADPGGVRPRPLRVYPYAAADLRDHARALRDHPDPAQLRGRRQHPGPPAAHPPAHSRQDGTERNDSAPDALRRRSGARRCRRGLPPGARTAHGVEERREAPTADSVDAEGAGIPLRSGQTGRPPLHCPRRQTERPPLRAQPGGRTSFTWRSPATTSASSPTC